MTFEEFIDYHSNLLGDRADGRQFTEFKGLSKPSQLALIAQYNSLHLLDPKGYPEQVVCNSKNIASPYFPFVVANANQKVSPSQGNGAKSKAGANKKPVTPEAEPEVVEAGASLPR